MKAVTWGGSHAAPQPGSDELRVSLKPVAKEPVENEALRGQFQVCGGAGGR